MKKILAQVQENMVTKLKKMDPKNVLKCRSKATRNLFRDNYPGERPHLAIKVRISEEEMSPSSPVLSKNSISP
jgi:hypothetical protein